MGIPANPVIDLKSQILDVTDSSPLFVEDLLRLSQAGVPIDKAIGLWAEKRGNEARKYAILREYEHLSGDGRQVLLALTLQGPCRAEDVCRGLDWNESRLFDAMLDLKKMFLVPKQSAGQLLALNRNTQLLVQDAFKDSDAYRRTDRLMKAAVGQLKSKTKEESHVQRQLGQARIEAIHGNLVQAEASLQKLVDDYPGRADVLSHLAWVQKKMGEFASARVNYQRANELGCNDRDAYWHWSEMEAGQQEWSASEQAASTGLSKFGDTQGLLFRQGYAIHRQGKEAILDGNHEYGIKKCEQAKLVLDRAEKTRDSEGRNLAIRGQILRAIILNLEMLNDGPGLARFFAQHFMESQSDSILMSEYERLRAKFPRFLSAR